MRKKPWQKRIISMFVVFLLMTQYMPHGYAQEGRKGSVAAESTELDRSAFVDPQQYTNEPVTLKTVRIGLEYGENAPEEAVFLNDGELGFYFGEYDEKREFQLLGQTDVDCLLIAASINGSHSSLYVLSAYDHSLLFQTEAGEDRLAILPMETEGETRTWFEGELYRGGFECRINASERITVINCLELEDYVKGVIPYEMSSNWPQEALRAQAVCARTYVVYNENAYDEESFDLTDDTESQVYRGILLANADTDAAVESTAGQYVRYKGEICEIYYFASDGGATEDGKNVFGSDRPYLIGKLDPFENAVDYSFRNWEMWFTGENLAWLLTGKEYEVGEIIRVEPEYSSVGNVISMNFFDDLGRHVRISGRDAYTSILLHNCRFTVSREGDYFKFQGNGWGHNCGMSQWGARAMAEVYGYDYQDIIQFYFTGAYAA